MRCVQKNKTKLLKIWYQWGVLFEQYVRCDTDTSNWKEHPLRMILNLNKFQWQ